MEQCKQIIIQLSQPKLLVRKSWHLYDVFLVIKQWLTHHGRILKIIIFIGRFTKCCDGTKPGLYNIEEQIKCQIYLWTTLVVRQYSFPRMEMTWIYFIQGKIFLRNII